MKCFNHRAADAVAVCRACGRGICPACAAEVDAICCCRDRCEAAVAATNDMLLRGQSIYGKTSATYFRHGVFTLLLGLLFALVGVYVVATTTAGVWGLILVVVGTLFGGMGVSSFVSARRMTEK